MSRAGGFVVKIVGYPALHLYHRRYETHKTLPSDLRSTRTSLPVLGVPNDRFNPIIYSFQVTGGLLSSHYTVLVLFALSVDAKSPPPGVRLLNYTRQSFNFFIFFKSSYYVESEQHPQRTE